MCIVYDEENFFVAASTAAVFSRSYAAASETLSHAKLSGEVTL